MALLALVFSSISLLTTCVLLYRSLQTSKALAHSQAMLQQNNQSLLMVSDALMDVSEGIQKVLDGSLHPVEAFSPSAN